MKKVNLNGEYRLYTYDHDTAPQYPSAVDGDFITANVPGNVENDYHNAGLLPDVMFGVNARKAAALERKDFWYVREFALEEPPRRATLCFAGVDTLADYFLNGEKIGSSENMLIEHRFLVDGLLRPGDNTLAVHIRSSVLEAKKYDIRPYCVAFPGCYENLHIRKSAMNYGWDISPRLVSAGIWKDVHLEIPEKNEFRDVYITTTSVYDDLAILAVSCSADIDDAYLGRCILRVSGTCGKSRFAQEYPMPHCCASVYPYVHNAKPWYPSGMGAQNLYEITLQLICDETVLAEYHTRFGIRTVKLVFGEKTGEEGQFHFLVNGKLLRCKGVNWVPLSLLHSQDPCVCREAVLALKESNSNMVRVWGGGVYESDEFFDLCDEYGILVWQDMMLSCHAYPSTQEFCDAIAEECEAVAKRLRNHPSLAIYCGGNETDWPYVSVGLDPNDDRISRDVMKRTLYEFDPFRILLPSTPYHSREAVKKYASRFYIDLEDIKNARTQLPDEHYWWHRDDYLSVREQSHKFISEIGYSGGSLRASVDNYLPSGWTLEDDAAWADHSYPTEVSRLAGIEYLFYDVAQNDDDKLMASQLYQAEAYKFVVELCRIRKENNGILLWTLRENWPSFSSALVDYYGERKKAFYTVKTSYEPMQCVVDVVDNVAECFLVNDRLDVRDVVVAVTDENGTQLLSSNIHTNEKEAIYPLGKFNAGACKLLLMRVADGEKSIFNYRFVYEGKMHYPTYLKLYETYVQPKLERR